MIQDLSAIAWLALAEESGMPTLYDELMTDEYLEGQIKYLLARRASKQEIISGGGEKAVGHTPSDIKRIDFALARIKSGQYGFWPLWQADREGPFSHYS